MDTVKIEVSAAVFQKLQKLATPLVDDTNSVIERLIAHWEGKPSRAAAESASVLPKLPQLWVSTRGEALPVGGQLRGRYLGKTYFAKVVSMGIEYNEKIYSTPSSAAIAVKNAAGTKGDSAATNGWDFWEILSPQTKQWRPIAALRKAKKPDVEAMLQELARS